MAQTVIKRAVATVITKQKWDILYDKYHKDTNSWDEVKRRTFQLLLLHCHPGVEEKLDTFDSFQLVNEQQDPIKLLELIRSIVHK